MAGTKALSRLEMVYQDIHDSLSYFESTEDVFNSKQFQERVSSSLTKAENAVHMVNMLDLFSKNEDIDEISTPSIKYLLLPAYLGYFTMKNMSDERNELVKKAQIYYIEFLKLIKLYNLTSLKIPKLAGNEENDIKSSRNSDNKRLTGEEKRNEKIQRYKRKKERDAKLKEMENIISSKKSDEEFEREYHFKLIDSWVDFSFEEIDSIEQELEILQYMKTMKKDSNDVSASSSNKPLKQKTKKLAPFILTRDKVQATVIGAGYPSLPTYTIEEWFDKTYGSPHGKNENGAANSKVINSTDNEEDKEIQIETDDPAYLEKARAWDDWKDDHRTGWGNRYNRS